MKIKANKILAVLCVIAMIMTMIVPMTLTATAAETPVATFALGADGTASHSDGSTATTYSETVGNYTLSITNGTQLYKGCRDAKGNGAIRLGSSKNVGSFKFTVPTDIVKVIVYVAQYKANTAQITVNGGTAKAIDTASNNGEYTPIEIDTSSNKTITIATTSSGKRCMVNTIEFYVAGTTEPDEPACEHTTETYEKPATKTEAGYKVEICTKCGEEVGDRTPTPALGCKVNFVVPTGVEAPDSLTGVLTATMPSADLPDGNYAQEYEFAGWATASVNSDTKDRPTLHGEGTTITLTDDTTFYAVYSYKVSNGEGATESGWIKKDISDIVATDVVVVTMATSSKTYALSNNKGSGSAPTAVVVEAANNKITSEVADTIKWNISNNNGNLTFYPNGATATWLYSTDTNNGTRVGTNTNKTWVIDATSGYLKHTGTSRYLGVYNGSDWRSYTNTTGNTAGQTLGFYVWTEGGIETYYTSMPTTSACDHANAEVVKVDATCEEAGSITTTCECGYSTVETIEALGHDWDDGEIVDAPDCTTPGEKEFNCNNGCGETKTEAIDATGHNFVDGTCDECGEALPVYVEYTFSEYAPGTQYAENEVHKLDSILTVTTTKCHFTSELRIYSSSTYNGFAIFTSVTPIYSISFNAGNKEDTLNVYGCNGSDDWELISAVKVTSAYTDYTVDFAGKSYTQIKIDVAGDQQIRLKSITAQYDLPAKITQASVNAGKDLSLLAYITLANGEDIANYKVIFVHESGEIIDGVYVETTEDGKYVFALNEIAPEAMADVFTVQIVKNGEDTPVHSLDYSIKAYAETILKGEYSDELKIFVTEMLTYGETAQKFTKHNMDNLATVGLEDFLVYGTASRDEFTDEKSAVQNADKIEGLSITGLGVQFNCTNKIYAKFTAESLDGITVTIDGNAADIVSLGGNLYAVYTDDILATGFGHYYEIVLNVNGEAYQTVNYSVYSFAKTNNDLGEALYNYGVAAVNYMLSLRA